MDKDAVILLYTSELLATQQKDTNRNARHLVLEGIGVTVCIFGTRKQAYNESTKSSQKRTRRALKELISNMKLTPDDVLDIVTHDSFFAPDTLKSVLQKPGSRAKQSIDYCNLYSSISTEEAFALLSVKDFTERDIGFFRRHFSGLPSVKSIRPARKTFLEGMPAAYTIEYGKKIGQN